ncbi:MAG: hypothetical protein KF812_08705 [Fimbriimonadaceae bacterium]|nr:hypothetical protein [Fimbriimonadaceae bacterium]
MSLMKRAGKVHWMIVTGIAGAFIAVAALIASFLFSDSPGRTASEFMVALATHDTKMLAKTSFIEGKSEAELEEDWKYATEVAGKHYRFRYDIKSVTRSGDTTASATLLMVRNADDSSAYEDLYGLPLEKIDGQWKVDLVGIDRRIFPRMPR